MAGARKKDGEMIALMAVAGLVLLPFLIVAVFRYFQLKARYVDGRNAEHIVDLWRALQRAGYGLTIMAFILVALIVILSSGDRVTVLAGALAVLLGAAGVYVGVLTGRAFAAGLLGVVVDFDSRTLTFPADGLLRSFDNVQTVLDSIIPHSVETIDLNAVTGINRQAGRTLIIHGDFGSRAITFSDKLRRDQLLNLIGGGRRHADFELAGADDYA